MSFLVLFISMLICVIISMALFTLLERKILAYSQIRKGPNKVALMGLLQPLADVIKLMTKEKFLPQTPHKNALLLGPMLALFLSLIMWSWCPMNTPSITCTFSVVVLVCVSSMNVYATFIAGWSSNSKYALLGCMRAIAQTISYEVSMALILLSVLCMQSTLQMNQMCVNKYLIGIIMVPTLYCWLITCLAETNRTPLDLAEGESEIVSGFNVEYSGMSLAMILMAEYMNIILMSLLTTTIFIGLSSPIMVTAMTMALVFMLVIIRATFPRMRYDKLMSLTWKVLLPMSLTLITLSTPLGSF